MGSIPPELSLDVTPTYISKTISCFLGELTTIGRVSERLLKLDDFVKRLEEEMRKIDAFKRELPLCMLLLKDAIVTLKEESMKCRARNVEPVLEEFMPLKKDSDEDEEREVKKEKNNKDKMNWMSTVQLWNNYKNIDSNFDQKQNPVAQFMKGAEAEYRHSSNDRSVFPATETPETRKKAKGELPVAGISLLIPPASKNPREETWGGRAISCSVPNSQSNLRTGPQPPERQSGRKQRRCWSPELHRRFVNALQQLGGSQVATPKQIRDLMQVDGLTNDEVKSHLQKYRLHTKRLPNATTTPEKQSMVILGGGLWMPLDQHSESSRQSSSQSGSPQGPLQLAGTGQGTSGTGSDIVDEEEEGEEDEEKSESNNWKIHFSKTGILQIKPMQGRT